MKDFITAVKDVEDQDEGTDGQIVFMVDDWEVTAYRPGTGQLGVLMAMTLNTSETEQIAGIINFFASVLDDASHHHLVRRMLDRRDPFGIEEVTEIMQGLVEEWTGHPTQQPTASTRSSGQSGSASTRRTTKSTSSAKRPIASLD